jgi:hypothetical protein
MSSPPGCQIPLSLVQQTYFSQENYAFASDGSYSLLFMVGTGSCPLSIETSGTLSVAVNTLGSYLETGANANLGGDWNKLVYNPQIFEATLAKNNLKVFFTPGTNSSGTLAGPCAYLQPFWDDPSYGCPCNGSWSVAQFSNGTSTATRIINKTECVLPNGNSSCPEDYYFNLAARYGSYRIYNISNNTERQLDITRPVYDSVAGYVDNAVYASFTADFSCPQSINNAPTTGVPTAAPTRSGTLALTAGGFSMLSCLWV